jgi:hypothetical protein
MDWAHDRNGEPIFGSNDDYVSESYPSSVRNALALLEIHGPGPDWIVEKLQKLHRSGGLTKQNRSGKWHSDLARVILRPDLAKSGTQYARQISSIPLIPLTDGTWSAAPSASNPIYFPDSLGTDVPSGLTFTLVEKSACECAHRAKLFELMGVKKCDSETIIERIIEYHKNPKTNFEASKRSDLVGHVMYLYRARTQLKPGDMHHIHFANETGNLYLPGRRFYADGLLEDSLHELFSGYNYDSLIHPDYVKGLHRSQKKTFVEWLESSAEIALVPEIRAKAGGIHNHFLFLLENKKQRVLGLLRRNWNRYSPQITKDVEKALSTYSFLCHSGDEVPLHKTFVPLPNLVQKAEVFVGATSCSFLDLPDGLHSEWTFLSRFGVGTTDGLDFYLWVLSQPLFRTNSNVEGAKKLYREILSRAWSDKAKVKCVHGTASSKGEKRSDWGGHV